MEVLEEMSLFMELIWAHLCMLTDERKDKGIRKKGKDILILGEGSIQWLDDTTLTAEAKYPIDFTQSVKLLVLSLHYNKSNSF